MKVICSFFSVLLFVINCLYSQTMPLKDTILANVCEKHKDILLDLFDSSNIRVFEIHTNEQNEQNIIIVKKYFPYKFKSKSFVKVSFELRETKYFGRIITVYFIHINEEKFSLIKTHRGQGIVEPSIVPTRFFWSLTDNVLVFYLVEEVLTEKLLYYFSLVL